MYSEVIQLCTCIYILSHILFHCGLLHNSKHINGLPWQLRQWGIHLQCRRQGFDPWVGKILWKRKQQPVLVFLPGESVDGGARWATVQEVAEPDVTHWPSTHRCVTNPCAAQWASLFTRPPYSSVLGSWQTPSPALPQLLSPLASSLFSRSVSPFLFCEVKRSESRSVVSDCLQPRGLYRARNSLGQNTGVGGLPLLQGTFPGTEDKFIPVIF